MSKFRTGAEEAAKGSSDGSFKRVEFFGLKDGETAIVRFLSDYYEWANADVHTMVPVQKTKPEGRQTWPDKVPAVCRKTKLPDGSTLYPSCYIHDHIRDYKGNPISIQNRTYTLAVMREEVIGDGSEALGGEAQKGKKVGYQDKEKNLILVDANGKPTGEVEVIKDIRLISQGYKNFFGHLEGMASAKGTLLNEDYWIKRKGDNKDTTYNIVPVGAQNARKADGSVVVFDLNDPEFAARYGITVGPEIDPVEGKPVRHYPEELEIDQYIEATCSDYYYGMYFDPSLPQIVNGGSDDTPAQTQSAPVAPKPEVEAAQMGDLRSRITDYAQPEKPTETAPQQPVSAGVVL